MPWQLGRPHWKPRNGSGETIRRITTAHVLAIVMYNQQGPRVITVSNITQQVSPVPTAHVRGAARERHNTVIVCILFFIYHPYVEKPYGAVRACVRHPLCSAANATEPYSILVRKSNAGMERLRAAQLAAKHQTSITYVAAPLPCVWLQHGKKALAAQPSLPCDGTFTWQATSTVHVATLAATNRLLPTTPSSHTNTPQLPLS